MKAVEEGHLDPAQHQVFTAIMESAEVNADQKRRSTEISIRTKIIRDTIAAQSAKMVALSDERKHLLAKRDDY